MHKTKDAEIDKPRVAFICVHNSCRSQIAEALGKHLASDVFESYSAGTETKNRINPDAVRIIKQLYGIDMEETQHPKLLEDIPPVDIVVRSRKVESIYMTHFKGSTFLFHPQKMSKYLFDFSS
jgi:protein-tyrosine-phosphatase